MNGTRQQKAMPTKPPFRSAAAFWQSGVQKSEAAQGGTSTLFFKYGYRISFVFFIKRTA